MNNENYVSSEVAKLLKEKGFPQECSIGTKCRLQNMKMPFYENTKILTKEDFFNGWHIFNEVYPTLYQAAKWLRKEKSIFIVIEPYYSHKYEVIEYEYKITTYTDLMDDKWKKSEEYYEIYEQCLNDAILEALKLINY